MEGHPKELSTDLDRLSVAQLVERACTEKRADSDARWAAIGELQRRSTPGVFDSARILLGSTDTGERIVGLDILGRFGLEGSNYDSSVDPSFVARSCLQAVSYMVEVCTSESDVNLLASAIGGLGHHCVPGTSDPVVSHCHHPAYEVRAAVAFSLAPLIAANDHFESESRIAALSALFRLAGDEVGEVRDWALFGIAEILDDDSPEIRDVLARHLDDPHEEARAEAERGLERREGAGHSPGNVLTGNSDKQ